MIIERELKKFNGMIIILCGAVALLLLGLMCVIKCRAQIDAKYEVRQQVELSLGAALIDADNDRLVLNNDRNLRDQATVWADAETGWWSDLPSVEARTAVRLTRAYETPVNTLDGSIEDLDQALKTKMKFAPTRWLAEFLWFGVFKSTMQHANLVDAVEYAKFLNWVVFIIIVLFFLILSVYDRDNLLQTTLAKLSLERQARYERYVWRVPIAVCLVQAFGILGAVAVLALGANGLLLLAVLVCAFAIVYVLIPDETIDAIRERARRQYERDERKQARKGTKRKGSGEPTQKSGGRPTQKSGGNSTQNGSRPALKTETRAAAASSRAGAQKNGRAIIEPIKASGSNAGKGSSNDTAKSSSSGTPKGNSQGKKPGKQPDRRKTGSGTSKGSTGPKNKPKRRALSARYYAKYERSGRETRPSLFRNLFGMIMFILGVSMLITLIAIGMFWKVVAVAIVIAALWVTWKVCGARTRKRFEEWQENYEGEEDDEEEDDEDEDEEESKDDYDEMSFTGEFLTSLGKLLIERAQKGNGR